MLSLLTDKETSSPVRGIHIGKYILIDNEPSLFPSPDLQPVVDDCPDSWVIQRIAVSHNCQEDRCRCLVRGIHTGKNILINNEKKQQIVPSDLLVAEAP